MGMESIDELKKLLAAEKLVFGADETAKLLRCGKLQRVFFSSNCDAQMKADVQRYCRLAGLDFVEFAQTSEEIGVLCRKPFAISVVGVLV